MTHALFLGTSADKSYIPYLKGMVNGFTCYVYTEPLSLIFQLESYCSSRQITKVISTNTSILSALLQLRGNPSFDPSLSDYQGSVFKHKSLEIVFVSPLEQLFSVPYGKFIAERFISKLVASENWHEPTDFKWGMLDESNYAKNLSLFSTAYAIAIDIETFKSRLAIRCIGYTGIFIRASDGHITTISLVLPLDSLWALSAMRAMNVIPVDKIFQNGKYDVSYLLRYNAAPSRWMWDTQHLFHCHYSELPKDLGFLNAFFLRTVVYWKDLAKSSDIREYYRYNAMDTWATANVWIQQILQMPEWAKRNYILAFPLVYPCLLSEMTGLKRDESRLEVARKEVDAKIDASLGSLQRNIGCQDFNPSSPIQVKQLLTVLGCADITTSGEKDLSKASYRHPLIDYLLGLVLDVRGLRKLKSTYLRLDSDAVQSGIHKGEGGSKEYKGRILYSLNPHGTDTGRLASKEHHFWTGLQIQNIPRGIEVKQTICCEEGFFLGECDLEQAESRDTGYISGDTALIKAVAGISDFHSVNAAAFFGLAYADIYSDEDKKVKNKPIRDLAKRTNHGANYNMGPAMMVETMGLKNIWKAQQLLGLNYNDPIKIAQHLLIAFHSTYSKLRGPKVPYSDGTYYAWVVREITLNRKLVSRAFHHTDFNVANYKPNEYIEQGDWTRYCFGKPDKNKLDLNSYVAHLPQSLNSRTLNEAFMRVFYEVALPNPKTFRLHAQIHDSILFSYKNGYECHAERVRECMEIPVSVRDVSGITRTFTVPAALKLGKNNSAIYWSELE